MIPNVLEQLAGFPSTFGGTSSASIKGINQQRKEMKKNIKQIEMEEKRIPKSTCLTFGDPTFDCSNAGDHDDVRNFSHQLCLEGNPDATILDPEFREFWFKVDKNSPKDGGITRRFHSWSKLSRVLATMLKFIDAVRRGWLGKKSKKPTDLKLRLTLIGKRRVNKFTHSITGDRKL